jgi:fatty acid desaturase
VVLAVGLLGVLLAVGLLGVLLALAFFWGGLGGWLGYCSWVLLLAPWVALGKGG